MTWSYLKRKPLHHGGIGAVQAATAAETVSVIVPFIADQPFWGARLHERGLSPRPIRQRSLTATRLTARLSDAANYRSKVRSAARTMATEAGADTALAVLETLNH